MAESIVKSLVAMGNPEDKVRKALELANNDFAKTLEYLTKGMPEVTPEKTPEISNEHGDEEKLESLPNGTPNEDNKNDENQGNENENQEEMKIMSQNVETMAMTPYRDSNNNGNDNNGNDNNFPAFNDANKSRYEWEWSSHGGTRWHSYNQEVNNILNKNLFIGKSIQINMNGNLYEMRRIDETTATQRNTQTNKVRNVRRKEINEIVDKFAIQRIIDIMNCTEKEARNAYIASNRDEERAINYILEESSKPRRQTRGGRNDDDDAWKSVFNKNEDEPFINNNDEIEEFDKIYGFSDDENNMNDDKNNNNNDKDQNNDEEDDEFIYGHSDEDNDINDNNKNNDERDNNDKGNNNDDEEDDDFIYGHSDDDGNDKDENDENNFQQNDAQSAAAQAALTRHNDIVKQDANVELNAIDGNDDDELDVYGYSDNDNNDNGNDNNNSDKMINID